MGKGKHFEDIWNEAEKVVGIMIEAGHDVGEPFKNIEHVLDMARNSYTLGKGYDAQTASRFVGDILWQLCAFCKVMENEGKVINSAQALHQAITERKISLLDPDDDKA
jgi:hypothetical protein